METGSDCLAVELSVGPRSLLQEDTASSPTNSIAKTGPEVTYEIKSLQVEDWYGTKREQ